MKNVRLLPVDLDFVFGFGPTGTTRTLLGGALSSMNPVYEDIKPGKSIFVIKGNPQGNKDAAVKDTKQWVIQISTSGGALKSALSSTPYVVFCGHSNMGLGPMFDPGAATSTSSFLNIGNPQAAINVPYLKEEGFNNLAIPDNEVPASVNNYWVLPTKFGANEIERYPNEDNKPPPSPLPFHAKSGKPKSDGYHFNRENGNEFLIVDIPVASRTADLPALGYQVFFYNSCSTVRDYSEVFKANAGSKFIASNLAVTEEWSEVNPPQSQTDIIFAQKLMAGESWQTIVNEINKEQKRMGDGDDAFRLVDF